MLPDWTTGLRAVPASLAVMSLAAATPRMKRRQASRLSATTARVEKIPPQARAGSPGFVLDRNQFSNRVVQLFIPPEKQSPSVGPPCESQSQVQSPVQYAGHV